MMMNQHGQLLEFDGEKLKSLRKELKLSAKDLASKLAKITDKKYDETSVYQWERGVYSPRDETKLAIAKALRCQLTDFHKPSEIGLSV
jgi:transcriptional regulator with XRE-family HTH domain